MGKNLGELIATVSENKETINAIISLISGSILGTVLTNKKKQSEELSQQKVSIFNKKIQELLDNGELTYVEFYKAKNYGIIAEKADQIQREKQFQFIPHEFEFDWYYRFYEEAGMVSNEKLQEYWSNILVKQVSSGGISLRTLSVLSKMTASEAKLFERIVTKTILLPMYGEYILPSDTKFLETVGITADEIRELIDMGLISATQNLQRILPLKLEIQDEEQSSYDIPISIPSFAFTNAGVDLLNTLEIEKDEQAFSAFVELFNEKWIEEQRELYLSEGTEFLEKESEE
ncbi:DUF2806 domain-containing protein [Streptococcus suis]|uniref:DUF2806 domain-containing protein n=1 Tax=Streptococcus suis TaxID=1307 RepID=UPI0005CD3B0B|nr:DUF2806 domain-containing protein [Streptococcus suis]MBM7152902.1 DUF2806 domain-containing protein [Streptococcus suis]MDG4502694.1 DUF2806 domain-containing protein [Streptococcus suis]NQH31483.1 DUF2806 domain-containing protein [Streptococcus suis]NQP00428.1 DUF2806 domain-containing protein [Streptococcus suis]NQP48362.1 DUF2806 domain-containing protein [Streptococcus suis]